MKNRISAILTYRLKPDYGKASCMLSYNLKLTFCNFSATTKTRAIGDALAQNILIHGYQQITNA